MSFEAYENNGGTCVCVAGDDFCVVAADTRMSEGYSIHTRHYHKLVRL
jgi:20S proteasome subunit beta 6